jgi:hypothetical protein
MMHASPQHQPLLRQLGIDEQAVFDHPLIRPWRTLRDRENCLLEAALPNGQRVRWHVKRYPATRGQTPAQREATGLELLKQHAIATMDLVAHGRLEDGRSFIIFDDLRGYQDAQRLINAGFAFERLLEPTARLVARLHQAGLHHRDLYLCHFFIREQADELDARLIDVARVRTVPRFFAQRWIVKDLAQFWYSTLGLAITDEQRRRWLSIYAGLRGVGRTRWLERSVRSKAGWIARNDRRLCQREPTRNISLPY